MTKSQTVIIDSGLALTFTPDEGVAPLSIDVLRDLGTLYKKGLAIRPEIQRAREYQLDGLKIEVHDNG